MSHNVANGGTFGIDALVRMPGKPSIIMQAGVTLPSEFGEAPKLPPETGTFYSITDYERHINLCPSDAVLVSILLLKDVFDREVCSGIKRPSAAQLAELKVMIDKITENGVFRE